MTDRLGEFIKNARTLTKTNETFSVTVRESLGIDEVDSPAYWKALRDAICLVRGCEADDLTALDWQRLTAYGKVMQRTRHADGVELPGLNDPPETLYNAMVDWLLLPAAHLELWNAALTEVDQPGDVPEVSPVAKKSKNATND